MKTRHAFLLAMVAVLGLCSSAFAAPMLTVDSATGAMTFWGSHAAAAAANPGNGISDPGGETDTSLTGLQVTDTAALTNSGDVAALYTPDVITGAFPFIQAQVFLDTDYNNSLYYAELLSPASLNAGVPYGTGDSTALDVGSAGGTGVSAEYSYEGGAATVAMDVAYTSIVPEPSTLLLVCLGLVGLAVGRRSAR